MHPTRRTTTACLVVALIACASARSAEAPFPVIGGFGFDWLAPQSAKCVRITPAMFSAFKSCEFHRSGAFGLPLAYHGCKARKDSELIVLKSAAACEDALATMHANEP